MPKRSYEQMSQESYATLLNNIHKAIRDLLFENDICIHNVVYDIRNSTIVISNFKDEQIAYSVYERLLSFPNIVSYMNRNIIITIPI